MAFQSKQVKSLGVKYDQKVLDKSEEEVKKEIMKLLKAKKPIATLLFWRYCYSGSDKEYLG